MEHAPVSSRPFAQKAALVARGTCFSWEHFSVGQMQCQCHLLKCSLRRCQGVQKGLSRQISSSAHFISAQRSHRFVLPKTRVQVLLWRLPLVPECKPLLHTSVWAQAAPVPLCSYAENTTPASPTALLPSSLPLPYCPYPTLPLKTPEGTVLWPLISPQRLVLVFGQSYPQDLGDRGSQHSGGLGPGNLFPRWRGQFSLASPHPVICCQLQAVPSLVPFLFLKLHRLN